MVVESEVACFWIVVLGIVLLRSVDLLLEEGRRLGGNLTEMALVLKKNAMLLRW